MLLRDSCTRPIKTTPTAPLNLSNEVEVVVIVTSARWLTAYATADYKIAMRELSL